MAGVVVVHPAGLTRSARSLKLGEDEEARARPGNSVDLSHLLCPRVSARAPRAERSESARLTREVRPVRVCPKTHRKCHDQHDGVWGRTDVTVCNRLLAR